MSFGSLGCVLLLLGGCATSLERFTFEEPQMGTTVRLVLHAQDEAAALAAKTAAFARISELNGILSDYDGQSELNRLCAQPAGTEVPVSDDLFAVLTEAQRVAAKSDGGFDVTVGPLVRLWRRAGRTKNLPTKERIDKTLKSIGYKHLQINAERRTATLRRPDMHLDLGGIAKGYAAGEALLTLRRRGLPHAMIDLGGDLALGSAPPGTDGWHVGLAPLSESAAPSLGLTLSECGVATSGDAFRFVEIDGVRYSHIVDPHTGLGLTRRSSVTVIAKDPMLADALASAVSVLGQAEGLALLESESSAEGFVIVAAETGPTTHRTSGFPTPMPLTAR